VNTNILVIYCKAYIFYKVLEILEISIEMPVPSQGHYGFHSFPAFD
jgi:hypothetical protein